MFFGDPGIMDSTHYTSTPTMIFLGLCVMENAIKATLQFLMQKYHKKLLFIRNWEGGGIVKNIQ